MSKFNNSLITKQLRQKDKMEDFIAEVNVFMNESYLETLQDHLETIRIYIKICQSWTIREKDGMIEKLLELQDSLNQRINTIQPSQNPEI